MRVTVRLTAAQLAKLDQMGSNRTRVVRQLIDSADVDAAPSSGPPSEQKLLELLAEKARQGNVRAITALLKRETQPGDAADAELERLLREQPIRLR